MNAFLSASGATAPLAIELEGPGPAVAGLRKFEEPFALVGRSDRAGLVLDHEAVSRRHAYVQVIGGRVFVVDLGSRSGTICDGRAADNGWLAPGGSLRIGPYGLRLASPGDGDGAAGPPGGDADPVANPLVALAAGEGVLPQVSLEFRSPKAGRSVWRMNPVLALVGSSARCNVRLSSADVSRFHCALIRTPAGLWAVDLLGRDGITVNGAPARYAALGPGDVLALGKVLVRVHRGDAAPRAGPSANLPELRSGGWQPPAVTTRGEEAPHFGTPAQLAAGQFPGGPDPSLTLLLNHFGQMQQQMLDQFQQSMMMMMQMFGGMHRDQMGLVREELEKIGELKEEFTAIKAQLAARPAPAAAPPPWRPHVPPPAGAPTRPLNGHPQAGPPAPAQAPAPQPPAGGDAKPRKTVVTPPDLSGDTHDWLNERLAIIEAEQMNRWQKIMGFLKGGR